MSARRPAPTRWPRPPAGRSPPSPSTTPSPNDSALPSRTDLEALTADMGALWHAPTTAPRDRKRLLRTLIADVTLLPEPDFAKARIGIRWHTGATDELVVSRRQDVTQYRRTDPAAIDLARSLSNLTNHDIAERLNAAGYVTGAGRPSQRRDRLAAPLPPDPATGASR